MNGICVPTLALYVTYSCPKNFINQYSSAVSLVRLKDDISYPFLEELPQHHDKDKQRDWIDQHDLRAYTEPEEAKV